MKNALPASVAPQASLLMASRFKFVKISPTQSQCPRTPPHWLVLPLVSSITMITENDGMIPTKEDIETATYFFVDVCQEYPASLIRFSAKVLIGHFEPLLERTTPTNKVYERLRANTQFVNAMRSLRAEISYEFVRTNKATLWLPNGL
ncbi:hypothetical protein QBC45DRAFT_444313 [Copromyces sp. CBS 386.78]|nr:hypothetical protein QBC45DRAFT_444313 [Copromyces sp. CBS 386.78]